MSNDIPTPDAHAQGWRLVSRDANTGKTWIDASSKEPALLLVLDTQGEWWGIAPQCRQCGGSLMNSLKKQTIHLGLDELCCSHCGTSHGHAIAGAPCSVLMVVDNEIYAVPG